MDTLWYAFGMGTHYGMGTYCMCTLGMGTRPNGYHVCTGTACATLRSLLNELACLIPMGRY